MRTTTSPAAAVASTAVAHRVQLPVGELLDGGVARLGERALEPVGHPLGGLDRGQRLAQQSFDLAHSDAAF
jgi:hypothetical protein